MLNISAASFDLEVKLVLRGNIWLRNVDVNLQNRSKAWGASTANVSYVLQSNFTALQVMWVKVVFQSALTWLKTSQINALYLAFNKMRYYAPWKITAVVINSSITDFPDPNLFCLHSTERGNCWIPKEFNKISFFIGKKTTTKYLHIKTFKYRYYNRYWSCDKKWKCQLRDQWFCFDWMALCLNGVMVSCLFSSMSVFIIDLNLKWH